MNTEKPSALAAFNIEALVLIMPSAQSPVSKTESPLLYLTRLPANNMNKSIFSGIFNLFNDLTNVQILPYNTEINWHSESIASCGWHYL